MEGYKGFVWVITVITTEYYKHLHTTSGIGHVSRKGAQRVSICPQLQGLGFSKSAPRKKKRTSRLLSDFCFEVAVAQVLGAFIGKSIPSIPSRNGPP